MGWPTTVHLLLLLLLLLVGRGRAEGPTWGSEEEEEEVAEVVDGLPTTAGKQPPTDGGGCPPCDPGSCVSPFGCLAGVVRDRCGCCQVIGQLISVCDFL